jgi:hypothetical protein
MPCSEGATRVNCAGARAGGPADSAAASACRGRRGRGPAPAEPPRRSNPHREAEAASRPRRPRPAPPRTPHDPSCTRRTRSGRLRDPRRRRPSRCSRRHLRRRFRDGGAARARSGHTQGSRCSGGTLRPPGRRGARPPGTRLRSAYTWPYGANRRGACAPEEKKPLRGRDSMRMRGLEPPRGCPHTDLNRARLPIPPHPRAVAIVAKPNPAPGGAVFRL